MQRDTSAVFAVTRGLGTIYFITLANGMCQKKDLTNDQHKT